MTVSDDDIYTAMNWLKEMNPDAEDYDACQRVVEMLKGVLQTRENNRETRRLKRKADKIVREKRTQRIWD